MGNESIEVLMNNMCVRAESGARSAERRAETYRVQRRGEEGDGEAEDQTPEDRHKHDPLRTARRRSTHMTLVYKNYKINYYFRIKSLSRV